MGHAPLIFFRTRGNHEKGMGDVFGALALSEAFRRKGIEPYFVIDNDKEAVDAIVSKDYKKIVIEKNEEDFWKKLKVNPDAIIVYQLHNPKKYIEMLKKYSKLVVTIDDIGSGGKAAHMRFNPLYYMEDCYFGHKYIPLRDEFIKNRRKKKVNKGVKNILVTLGGADTYGFTPKVITALSKIEQEIEIIVVLGPAFRHERELESAIKKAKRPFTIIRNAQNIRELMENADIAVCSGGNTLFEMAFTGTPAVVICGELFEEETAKRMEAEGFGISLGFGGKVREEQIFKAVNALIGDYPLRLRMSRNGQKLVDGAGADRIAKNILDYLKN